MFCVILFSSSNFLNSVFWRLLDYFGCYFHNLFSYIFCDPADFLFDQFPKLLHYYSGNFMCSLCYSLPWCPMDWFWGSGEFGEAFSCLVFACFCFCCCFFFVCVLRVLDAYNVRILLLVWRSPSFFSVMYFGMAGYSPMPQSQGSTTLDSLRGQDAVLINPVIKFSGNIL